MRIRQAASGPQPSLTPGSRNRGDVRETPAASLSTCPGRSALHASDAHARQQVHVVVGPVSQVGTLRKTRATSPESRGGGCLRQDWSPPAQSHSVPPSSPSAGWGPGDKRQEQRRHLGIRVSGVLPPVTSQGRQRNSAPRSHRGTMKHRPPPHTRRQGNGASRRVLESVPQTQSYPDTQETHSRERRTKPCPALFPHGHPLIPLPAWASSSLPPLGPHTGASSQPCRSPPHLSLQPPARTGSPGQVQPLPKSTLTNLRAARSYKPFYTPGRGGGAAACPAETTTFPRGAGISPPRADPTPRLRGRGRSVSPQPAVTAPTSRGVSEDANSSPDGSGSGRESQG